MKKHNTIIAILALVAIILGSILIITLQDDAAKALPYTIGSPVTPATQMPMGMVMKTFDVPSTEPVPTVSFTITPDTMGGWNVHVMTTNFTFTPEDMDQAPVPGEGHAHLYIDNDLIIMTGPWYHIDALTPGTHTIKVGLFNNDHSAYSANGTQIQAIQQLAVNRP